MPTTEDLSSSTSNSARRNAAAAGTGGSFGPLLKLTRRRQVIIPAAVVGILAVLAFVAWETLAVHSGGPLESHGATIGQRVEPGQSYTFGVSLPQNTTSKDIFIQSVAPGSVDGVELLGITASENVPIGTAIGYPPEEYDTVLLWPSEFVIPPDNGIKRRHIFLGVRLRDGVDVGTIEGVRIRYRHGWRTYETEFGYAFLLLTPEAWEREQSR